jgi:hypothetical protein
MYSLESFVVGVVDSEKVDRTEKATPIDRNLEQFSVIYLSQSWK